MTKTQKNLVLGRKGSKKRKVLEIKKTEKLRAD
jgi:hypothetical protein